MIVYKGPSMIKGGKSLYSGQGLVVMNKLWFEITKVSNIMAYSLTQKNI